MHRVFAAAMGCALALAAYAQDYRGSLLGRVTDPTDAVIPGAEVVAQHEGSQVQTRAVTNAEGNFLIPHLEPGAYTVSFEATGFKRLVRAGITVRTGEKLELNVRLDVGTPTESITVTAELPLLQTASADLAQVVDRRFIDSLYVPNRNPLSLIALTPGVRSESEWFGGRFADSQQHFFSVHGGGATMGRNEIVVDGASVVMPRQGGSIGTSPSGDTVEELRVQTTMFDAAYGHTNGGVISYATRSGTNELHGSFEGFIRNEIFNANSWTNNKRGVPRPDDNRQFYSGTLGGPVVLPRLYNGRNRTFFFTSVQWEGSKGGNTYSARVPTEAERRGDFSRTLNAQGTALTIYNPYSSVVTGTTVTRQPFPGNVIPASLHNETGQAILSVYPAPNLNVPAQIGLYNWVAQSSHSVPSKQISQRFDHVLSPRQRLFGRFAFMDFAVNFREIPQGLRSAPIGGTPNADFRHFYNASLNDDFAFSPTAFGSLRIAFSRYWSDTVFSGNNLDPKVLKLHPDILSNQIRPAWPGIDMGEGFYMIGHRFKIRANDSYVVTPSLTKLSGAHNLRVGADVRLVNWNEISPDSQAAGYFTFRPTFTVSDPFVAATSRVSGTAMASLLMGIPDSGAISGPAPYALRSYYTAVYIQDDWKITRKLTLNLGLRWEVETPYTERFNQLSWGFDYDAPSPVKVPGMDLRGGLVFAGVDNVSRRQGKTDWNNFGPRFGFAYQVLPSTVVRGGYGIFYSSAVINLDTTVAIPPTFSTSIPYVGTVDRGVTPFTTLAAPFPQGVPRPRGNQDRLAARVGDSITFLAQDRVLPYSQQWQFSVQQALPAQTKVEVAFVRMLSLKGLQGFNLNEKPDRYLELGAAENTRVPNPFYGILPANVPLGSSATIAQRQFWLAYPQFTSVSQQGTNAATTVYHSVFVNVEKRLTHGLTVLFNHTISKMIENNLTSLVNKRYYRCISDMDRPHVTNLAFVYDLPFGQGQPWLSGRGLWSRLLGGWSLSGRFYYSSGTPLSISDANGRPYRLRNAALSGPIRDRIGDRIDPVTREVLNPYFDTKAFASLPTQHMVPPEPPHFAELRAPHRKTLDASVIKRIRVYERLNLDVRADATNVTNSPQWDAPGTNMASKATFGVIQTAGGNRIIQLSIRGVF